MVARPVSSLPAPRHGLAIAVPVIAALIIACLASPAHAQQPIGSIRMASPAEPIRVSGAVTLQGSTTLLGNGSTVTAGHRTLAIHLMRGGELDLCATTSMHLSQKATSTNPNSPLMLALDHGALEAHYRVGKNSDVILTPDLRILLSGPGRANVSIRVNQQGDTCVDNPGDNAPYVTVTEQMGDGVYRVQPNQRVTFEHGSVRDVVDQERQPCGCPVTPTVAVARVQPPPAAAPPNPNLVHKLAAKLIPKPAPRPNAAPAAPVGGPSSTPADTAFPLAESEGLAPPPGPATQPVAQPGTTQTQVTSTLSYAAPPQTVPGPEVATPASSATSSDTVLFGTASPTPEPDAPDTTAAPAADTSKPAKSHHHSGGPFLTLGRWIARFFGYGVK
jgi:hypothetical protein